MTEPQTYISEMLLLLLLIPNSICDGTRREVLPLFTVVMGGIGVIFRIVGSYPPVLADLLPGILLLLAAALVKGQIGCGDGLVLLAVGCCTNWETALSILVEGCLLGAAYGMLIGKRSIPLVPFLLAGNIAGMLWNVLKCKGCV